MSYIGSPPQFAQFPSKFFDGDGSAMTVTLDYAPPNLAALLVFISGVRQDTSAYTLSGTSLTFTGTVPSGTANVQVVHLGLQVDVGTPGDDTVTNAKLANMAANTVKVRDANSSGDPSDKALATTEILIGDGTGFTAAALSSDVTMTNAGAVTIADDAVTTVKILDNNVTTAKILDNNVTLAKLDDGTQGDILYYGASGAPARLGFGTDGHFLKTQGTGANPVWAADTGGLFESYACIADKVAASVAMQTITSGAWRTRNINTEITDPDGIVSISSDQFTLAAGSYILRVSMEVTKGTGHSTRIYDITNTAVVEYGGAGYMDTGNNEESWAPVIARVTPSGATVYEVQQIVTATAAPGSSSSHSDQMYLFCEIFKEA